MVDSIGGGGGWPLNGIPVGLGMAVAADQAIPEKDSKLTEAEKEQLIAKSYDMKSEKERDEILNSLL